MDTQDLQKLEDMRITPEGIANLILLQLTMSVDAAILDCYDYKQTAPNSNLSQVPNYVCLQSQKTIDNISSKLNEDVTSIVQGAPQFIGIQSGSQEMKKFNKYVTNIKDSIISTYKRDCYRAASVYQCLSTHSDILSKTKDLENYLKTLPKFNPQSVEPSKPFYSNPIVWIIASIVFILIIAFIIFGIVLLTRKK